MDNLTEMLSKANPKQLEAIETIDGPVLVVAGPGTGKTQLLSLRVANILTQRDISPENILCLTFTDAGSEAMSKRLTQFIGKQAYQVRINTFHAFASYLASQHIEFFDRSPFDTLITGLQTKKLISHLLKKLSVADPLFSKPSLHGVPNNLNDVIGFMGKVKTSGLSTDELRAIAQQGLDTIDYISQHTNLEEKMTEAIPRKKHEKADHCDELKAKAAIIFGSLPKDLIKRKVALPGSYEPLALYLARVFDETDWYEGENNSTTGFQALRKQFFDTKTGEFSKSFKKRYLAMLSALNIFDQYQAYIKAHGLFDYNDMILDAISAIEQNEDLRICLQDQYRYILIDEFQDTNGSQMRIVDLLTQGKECPNIMAVGDDDQAIMRFQGASVAFLKQFEETYAGTKRIVLKTNYRSTPSIVKLGQDVAVQIEGRSEASKTEKDIVAFKQEEAPTDFAIKTYASRELQYYEVAKSIRERIDAGFVKNALNPAEAIAVIAWQHKSLAALIPYLKMFDIDFNYAIITTVAKTESLQGLLACLRYVSYLTTGDTGRGDPWLPQVLASVELGIEADEYVRFALSAKKNPHGWTAALRGCDSPGLSQLKTWLTQCIKHATSASALKAILYIAKPFIDHYKENSTEDPFISLEFNYGVSALLDFVSGERTATNTNEIMKLGNVVQLLDEADRFEENINVSVPLARPEAISLKTAHNSKGLEYDLVYMLDVDEATWHGRSKSSSISCPNIYLNEKRDEDDMRRLLFVAITRARYELEMSLGRSGIVAELLEHVTEVSVELSSGDIEAQSMVVWQDRYYPSDPTMRALVDSALAEKRLSASSLNTFVKYVEDDPRDGTAFIMREAFKFPQPPITYFEFGTIAHRYLELYLNGVVKTQDISADKLLTKIHEEINALDFDTAELDHMHEQLNLIAEVFIPQADAFLNKDAMSEQWINADVDGVPLVGRSDLLRLDNERKTIWVCDYKTGSPKNLGDDYWRQLVFYKILIEESGDYHDWTVLGGTDIFIEPDATTKELTPPQMQSVPAADVEHVRKLIQAVYRRIQNANFDTSGFDATGIDKKEVQRAYEDWLINDFVEHVK